MKEPNSNICSLKIVRTVEGSHVQSFDSLFLTNVDVFSLIHLKGK